MCPFCWRIGPFIATLFVIWYLTTLTMLPQYSYASLFLLLVLFAVNCSWKVFNFLSLLPNAWNGQVWYTIFRSQVFVWNSNLKLCYNTRFCFFINWFYFSLRHVKSFTNNSICFGASYVQIRYKLTEEKKWVGGFWASMILHTHVFCFWLRPWTRHVFVYFYDLINYLLRQMWILFPMQTDC